MKRLKGASIAGGGEEAHGAFSAIVQERFVPIHFTFCVT
jgi:hypothetical protein